MRRVIGLLVVLALGLTGCVNTASMVKELSKSKRSWCLYWAGGMGVGAVRVSGSGVESEGDGTAAAMCDHNAGSVNMTGGPAAPGTLPPAAIVTPGGDVILRAAPRILQQEAPTYREVEPPAPPARRAPAIRPQSAPRSQLVDEVLMEHAAWWK